MRCHGRRGRAPMPIAIPVHSLQMDSIFDDLQICRGVSVRTDDDLKNVHAVHRCSENGSDVVEGVPDVGGDLVEVNDCLSPRVGLCTFI